jgi:hypothetical protein
MGFLRTSVLVGAIAMSGMAAPVMADTVLVDRGLPTANLNTGNYATRSDIDVGYGPPVEDGTYFTGDDFAVSGAGQYRINTISTWAVAGSVGTDLSSLFTDVTLYGGTAADGISIRATGSTTGSNPNVVIQAVTFAGGQNYETVSGDQLQLWKIDFNNLNWIVNGNELMQFGVNGTFAPAYLLSDPEASWFNLSTNAALAGSTQQGSDNRFQSFVTGGDLGTMYTGSDQFTPDGYAYIGSDVNVQVVGAVVPLPVAVWSGLVLLGSMGGYKKIKRLCMKA